MLLRTRVTIIVSITYALMAAGLTFAGLKSEDLANERYAEATLNGQDIFWRKLVENTLQRLEVVVPVLATRPDVIQAAARRNPAALAEAMAPLAEGIRSHPQVSRWEVVSPEGELLYSSAGSMLDPPLIDAGTVRMIVEGGKPHAGIVLGADHVFAATVAVPLMAPDGSVAGIATIGADLHPPLEEFKASTGSDIFLVDRIGRLALGTDAQLWQRLDNHISVRKGHLESWKDGTRFFSVVVLPLHDAEDHVIGALVTLRDFSASQQRETFIRRAALGAVGGFFCLVLLGFTFYLRRSFLPLDEAIQVLNALSRGDTSVGLEVRNDKDEIGRIAATVGVFRDNAVKLEMLELRRERQRRRQELFIRLQMQRLSEMLEDEAQAAVLANLAEIAAREQGGGVAAPASDRGEIEVLARAFQTMSDRIREQHGHLEQLITERTRDIEILREALRTRDQLAALRQELDFARELQLSSLPQLFPPFPDRDEFKIHAAMIPAKEVGGDFYDFFFIDRHHLGFAIGDASGKGVPAAMFIAITRSLIKVVAPLSASPGECLAFVNTMLSADNPQLLFATTFYAVLDTRTGEVEFCNAGHPAPLILRADGRMDAIRDVSGVALGVMEDLDYDTGRFTLASGDTVLLYTDGVTEATDVDLTLFDEPRLMAVLGQAGGVEPRGIINRIEGAVDAFAGDAPQFDDITMLALRFERVSAHASDQAMPTRRLMPTGFKPAISHSPLPMAPPAPQVVATALPGGQPGRVVVRLDLPNVLGRPAQPPGPVAPAPAPTAPPPAAPRTVTARIVPPVMPAPPRLAVTIHNDLAELERLAGVVAGFVAQQKLPESLAFTLNLCLDELITNIISYGYADRDRHEIHVALRIENRVLITEIQDDARAYDPFTEAPEPDLGAEITDRSVGGLGVFLVKEYMDQTYYRRHNAHNLVTLVKQLDKEV